MYIVGSRSSNKDIDKLLDNTNGMNHTCQLVRSDWCAGYVYQIINSIKPEAHVFNNDKNIYPSCTMQVNWFKEHYPDYVHMPSSNYTIKPYDIIYYDFDHINEPRPVDHVGIVYNIDPDSGKLISQEGNTGGVGWQSSKVSRRSVKPNDRDIYCIVDISCILPDIISELPISNLSDILVNIKLNKVMVYQHMLNYMGSNIVVDGYFGPKTKAATIKFQISYGLEADGIAGPQTIKALINRIFGFSL